MFKVISELKIDRFLHLSKAQKQNNIGKRKILGDFVNQSLAQFLWIKGLNIQKNLF